MSQMRQMGTHADVKIDSAHIQHREKNEHGSIDQLFQ
jgi:hypothetical protein